MLVETTFIDNPDDAKLLVEREDDFARAIARGVTDYFANEKPLPDVIDTPADKKIGKHFDISEFVCHCCGRGADRVFSGGAACGSSTLMFATAVSAATLSGTTES